MDARGVDHPDADHAGLGTGARAIDTGSPSISHSVMPP
jgi:hypothetical protein